MDIEVEMLRKYTAITMQRKNALQPVGRLPRELLGMIFAYAQSAPFSTDAYPEGWVPRRRWVVVESSDDTAKTGEKKKAQKVVRYALGWIYVTHVCSAWRTVRTYTMYSVRAMLTLQRLCRHRFTPRVYGSLSYASLFLSDLYWTLSPEPGPCLFTSKRTR